MNKHINLVIVCVLTLWAGQVVSFAAEGDAINRKDLVGRELDCVEQNYSEDRVSWNSVCYMGSRASWEDETSGYSSGYDDYSQDRVRQFRNLEEVEVALNDWEHIERRHEGLSYEMAEPAKTESYSSLDYRTPSLTDGRFARENVRKSGKKHTFELDWEIFSYKYEEPEVMEMDGIMNGLASKYTYRPDGADLLYFKVVNAYRLEGMFAFGDLDYQADAGYGNEDNRNYFFDLRCLIAKEFIHDGYELMIFSGYGFRYLNDEEASPIPYQGVTYLGYERESHYNYVPFGFEINVPLENNWRVTFNGEYDRLIVGWQTSHLSDMNKYAPSLPSQDIYNRQNSGYGLRGSLKFAKSIEQASLFIEPFIRYWNISDSEVKEALVLGSVSQLLEPRNNTFEGGIKFGAQF